MDCTQPKEKKLLQYLPWQINLEKEVQAPWRDTTHHWCPLGLSCGPLWMWPSNQFLHWTVHQTNPSLSNLERGYCGGLCQRLCRRPLALPLSTAVIILSQKATRLVRKVLILMKLWRRSWKSNKVFQITLEMENPTFYFQTYLNNHLKMSHHIPIRGRHHTASAAISPLRSSILFSASSLQFSISGVTQVSPPSLSHYFVILSPFCPSWMLPSPATQPTAWIQLALVSSSGGVLGTLGEPPTHCVGVYLSWALGPATHPLHRIPIWCSKAKHDIITWKPQRRNQEVFLPMPSSG